MTAKPKPIKSDATARTRIFGRGAGVAVDMVKGRSEWLMSAVYRAPAQ
jgi:hypothetical protein